AERGFIKSLDALAIGRGSVVLGAGRQTLASVIDPAVGVILKKKIGDKVEAGEMVMEIKYNDDKKLADALPHFQGSIAIGETTVPTPMVIIKTLGDI
ncbi:MAG: hypothetical protein HOC09_32280, partial [Deltaproteobacteria bacterium]|nr:hypothetical protein [Deltaproteobacteria bacterium]